MRKSQRLFCGNFFSKQGQLVSWSFLKIHVYNVLHTLFSCTVTEQKCSSGQKLPLSHIWLPSLVITIKVLYQLKAQYCTDARKVFLKLGCKVIIFLQRMTDSTMTKWDFATRSLLVVSTRSQWPNSKSTGLWAKQSGFDPWLWSLCCVLTCGWDTLITPTMPLLSRRPRPGLEPGPLDLERSALTMRPLYNVIIIIHVKTQIITCTLYW